MSALLVCAGLSDLAWGQAWVSDGPTRLAPIVDAGAGRPRHAARNSPSVRLANRGPVVTRYVRNGPPRGAARGAIRYPVARALGSETISGGRRLPAGFFPWWQPLVVEQLREAPDVRPVDLDALIVSALAFSPRVRTVSEDVLIQETAIVEAQAAFDIHAFMDSKFFRKSEPIGNLLETGGAPRLREGDWRFSAGLRKRTPLGGSWEVSQRIGMRDSNSRFFAPEQQGNSRLSLSFNQPLLNGFGKAYNTALILLADIDTTVAMDQTSAALQSQLILIVQAYWELHLQRSILIQKRRHLERAQMVYEQLANRREVDALESQIVRARAAVATRRAELVRAATNIRNVEAKIRSLTNSPDLLASPRAELIPLDHPAMVPVDVDLQDALVTALQYRPEVDAASREIQAASVRLKMSRNELKPALDLVLETYVSGLDADYDITQSWADQFSVGEPSYTAGLVFEVPLGRRAAKARLQRRRLQLRQLTQRFEDTVQTMMTDVEIAAREVTTTYDEMVGKYRSMKAAETEVDYSARRWQLLSGEDRSASLLLEDLLDAQDRLAAEEIGFALAQRDYTISQTELKRAMGTLLHYEQIEPVRTCQGGLPELHFHKAARIVTPAEVLPPVDPRPRR